jgi:hypothetical protein
MRRYSPSTSIALALSVLLFALSYFQVRSDPFHGTPQACPPEGCIAGALPASPTPSLSRTGSPKLAASSRPKTIARATGRSSSSSQASVRAPARPPVSIKKPPSIVTSPPAHGGYFKLAPVGAWRSLSSGPACKSRIRYSTWEPRPDNDKPNHRMPNPAAVHAAFKARPRAVQGADDPRWDSWMLQRVDGQFMGTTDEIFQWAACKWGLPDDVLRGIAVRESTWYQYETYPSARCVTNWGCGDMHTSANSDSATFCDGIARYGHDYQRDYGAGLCPKTFSIVGVMSWQAPSWGAMPGNQNGTFPFNRDSTAFAVDYLAGQLRACYEGWEHWLNDTGTKNYAAGELWGCVGSWYAGDWHSSTANGYIARVRNEIANYTWLTAEWPHIRHACDPTYGCPGPGRL